MTELVFTSPYFSHSHEDFEDTSYFGETPTEEMADPDVEAAQVEDGEVVAADQSE